MAFVTEAALIALREGLEALLITGILLGLVTRMGHRHARKHVWLGFWAAVATSLVAGWAIQRYLYATFEEGGGGAWFELVAALLAVATLTYMAFWMWSHTTQVLRHARDRVKMALTTGSLATIVFIAYISVVREGLETVLFYSALANQATPFELAWSGLVGFAVSAALVVAILKGSRRIGLQRFFTITGLFLIVVAAMLLTHVVGALTELGALQPQPAIWDTSAAIADDSIAGRVLHATLGYTATPSLLQAVLYFGYLFIAGGTYLWVNGFFHRATTRGRQLLPKRAGVAAMGVLLVVSMVTAGATNPPGVLSGHSHGGPSDHADAPALPEDVQVGVLLRHHGEPVHYNETTYQSFADFGRRLLTMMGMEALLQADQGTILLDQAHPFAKEAHYLDAQYVDAWLGDHPGPAVYMGTPSAQLEQVPLVEGYYLAPGGPGLGEPDVLEMIGLGAYQAWLQMEEQSPMHHDKERVTQRVVELLQERFGDQVRIGQAYHIRPHVGPNETLAQALDRLQGTDLLVDAYTSHLHSDVMNACMMRPTFEAALDEAGYGGEVVASGPAGTNASFATGMAQALAEKLARYPADQRVALVLTHHGMTPGAQSPCRDRADPYNQQARQMFQGVKEALEPLLGEREVLVLQAYGQGADATDDGVLSPQQALDEARAWGAQAVLDVPYELPGNGYDNLVNHRLSYGFTPDQAPYYGPGYQTILTRDGMHVTIDSSAFAAEARAQAQFAVIEHAILDGLQLQEGHEH